MIPVPNTSLSVLSPSGERVRLTLSDDGCTVLFSSTQAKSRGFVIKTAASGRLSLAFDKYHSPLVHTEPDDQKSEVDEKTQTDGGASIGSNGTDSTVDINWQTVVSGRRRRRHVRELVTSVCPTSASVAPVGVVSVSSVSPPPSSLTLAVATLSAEEPMATTCDQSVPSTASTSVASPSAELNRSTTPTTPRLGVSDGVTLISSPSSASPAAPWRSDSKDGSRVDRKSASALMVCRHELACSNVECKRIHGEFEPIQAKRLIDSKQAHNDGFAMCVYQAIGRCREYTSGKCTYRHFVRVNALSHVQKKEFDRQYQLVRRLARKIADCPRPSCPEALCSDDRQSPSYRDRPVIRSPTSNVTRTSIPTTVRILKRKPNNSALLGTASTTTDRVSATTMPSTRAKLASLKDDVAIFTPRRGPILPSGLTVATDDGTLNVEPEGTSASLYTDIVQSSRAAWTVSS